MSFPACKSLPLGVCPDVSLSKARERHQKARAALLAASPSSTPRAPLSMHGVKDDQDDEGQKGYQLDAKEGKSRVHECVGLYMRHVNRGLYDSGSENPDRQSIDSRTCNTADVERQYDGAEDRQILDAVSVCPHRAPIPVVSFNLIRTKSANPLAPKQDCNPPIDADGCHQQEQSPCGESKQSSNSSSAHAATADPCRPS